MLTIIGTPSSPYTRKVRLLAHEKGIPLEFRLESPLAEGSSIPRLNPLAKIPVLIREDGSTLIDSPIQCEYLDALVDAPRLIPLVGPERWAVKEWEAIADGVLDAVILVRFESLRPESERSPAWVARQMQKVEQGLTVLDARLGGRTRCVGLDLTLADLAVGCCIGYLEFRFPDGRWRERHANLGRLMTDLERRASFEAVPMHA